MRYEIQTLFANGEWENTNNDTYPTIIEAYTEKVKPTINLERA